MVVAVAISVIVVAMMPAMAPFLAAIVDGVVGAIAGDIGFQAAALAVGDEHSFNWNELGHAALTGLETGIITGMFSVNSSQDAMLNGTNKFVTVGERVGSAMEIAITTTIVQQATGEGSLQWRGIVAGFLSALSTQAMYNKTGGQNANVTWERAAERGAWNAAEQEAVNKILYDPQEDFATFSARIVGATIGSGLGIAASQAIRTRVAKHKMEEEDVTKRLEKSAQALLHKSGSHMDGQDAAIINSLTGQSNWQNGLNFNDPSVKPTPGSGGAANDPVYGANTATAKALRADQTESEAVRQLGNSVAQIEAMLKANQAAQAMMSAANGRGEFAHEAAGWIANEYEKVASRLSDSVSLEHTLLSPGRRANEDFAGKVQDWSIAHPHSPLTHEIVQGNRVMSHFFSAHQVGINRFEEFGLAAHYGGELLLMTTGATELAIGARGLYGAGSLIATEMGTGLRASSWLGSGVKFLAGEAPRGALLVEHAVMGAIGGMQGYHQNGWVGAEVGFGASAILSLGGSFLAKGLQNNLLKLAVKYNATAAGLMSGSVLNTGKPHIEEAYAISTADTVGSYVLSGGKLSMMFEEPSTAFEAISKPIASGFFGHGLEYVGDSVVEEWGNHSSRI